MRRILPWTLAAALVVTGCKKSVPDNVAALVNNRPISYADLDKQFQLQFAGDHPNDDQAMTQKLEVLRTLIDNEIMLQRAEKQSLMAVDADVEAKFNELKAPYTQEEFQRQLNARKISADDLKAQLRRDLSVQKLIAKEITSHIAISDKDVADFYNSNKASFNLAEPQVHLSQILVTPQPNPDVRNLKNDKAQTEDQAKAKIQMIEARLHQGEDFAVVAQSFSEDPSSAANGGDLGFVPESALEKANPELRKMVMSMQAGQVSRIIRTPEGYRLLRVISKEPAGQRELNDPRVQQSIRETLINRKDQLFRAAFYEVARNEAQVTNQLAISIIQKKDKK
jgi:peptidyl-prolyl cis-trans isomerase SurA